jgi:hypothetical protein
MTTIERSYPDATCPALRCQVGIVGRRPEQLPIFRGKEVIGHRPGAETVPVFCLIGYGSTEARAQARAKGAKGAT